MATLQGKAVKNTYRQVLQIGASNVGVSGTLQPVQDGGGVNTALSLSTTAATVNGDLTITGDLIITGGGIQIKDLIDDTVADLIQNGTGITWTYDDGAATLTGNFTGTTSVVPEGSNLYYTQGRFDSAFAAKSTTNLAEGTNLYFTEARGNANFATNLAASDTDDLDEGVTNLYYTEARDTANFNSNLATKDTDDLAEGSTNLYYTNARSRNALSVTAGTGIDYNSTTGNFNLGSIPNASLTNSSITVNGISAALGASISLTTTDIAEGTNLYWTNARFDSRFGTKTTTDLAEGTNLYYTQARFNTAFDAKTTTDLDEGTNLYYTDARSRAAISESAVGLDYSSASGVLSLTSGYAIPTTVKLGEYDTAYNRSIVSAGVTGTSTKTLSLTQQDANVITATWTDQGITTINGTANQIAATTVGNTTTLAFTNDVTMPNNLVVSGNLTINGTATYVNTESISSKDPLFEVANTNNTTDAVDIGYYGRYYDAVQERVEFTGLFRDASDAGKFKIFNGLVDEPTNVVNTTGTGYTVATLVANVDGNLNGTANAANILSTARTISATGDAAWSVSFDGSANATAALTLANTGVAASTYGTTTAVPTIAVDSKGRITSASNTNIAFPVTTVNGQAGTVVLTTSDVAEGSNQYFTTARAQASITGGASSVVTADLTASRVLVSDGSGKIAASASITTTDLGYLSGVTSAIQTQLDSKLNLSGGTLTGGLSGTTGSFSGILTTPEVKAATSAGLSINANSGTQVANFGAGGGANITLYGGLTGTSASFSSIQVNGAQTISNAGSGDYLTIQNSDPSIGGGETVSLVLDYTQAASSTGWKILSRYAGGNLQFVPNKNNAGYNNYSLSLDGSTGAATFSSSVNINASPSSDRMFQVSGTAFTSGSSQFGIVLNPTWSGTITNVFGIYGGNNFGTGTITNSYNLYIEGTSTGSATVTNKWGIYQAGSNDKNYFAGNVGIATIDPQSKLQVGDLANVSGVLNDILITGDKVNANGYYSRLMLKNSSQSGGSSASIRGERESTNLGTALTFYTNSTASAGDGTERMRITSGGNVLINQTTTDPAAALAVFQLTQNYNNWIHQIRNSATTGDNYGSNIVFSSTPNNTASAFFAGSDSSAERYRMYANGGLANYQANNVNLSDERTKKDIIPLESYWDKFKDIEIVKFKYKDQSHDDFNIGVIAQQVETVAPEFIDVDGWGEIPEDGIPLKTVYTSDLHHATIKVLQEAMSKIETLEAEMAILKAK